MLNRTSVIVALVFILFSGSCIQNASDSGSPFISDEMANILGDRSKKKHDEAEAFILGWLYWDYMNRVQRESTDIPEDEVVEIPTP